MILTTILMTDRYGVSSKLQLLLSIEGGKPPGFICYDCKLWKHQGCGLKTHFYSEVEDFQLIN
jgi:hypothetical protein